MVEGLSGRRGTIRIYDIAFIVLFALLVVIALWAEGPLRTHGGDVLVVLWLFLGLRMTGRFGTVTAVGCVLSLAFGIEFAQLLNVDLDDKPVLRLAFGHVFDILDLLAYSLGAALAGLIDVVLIKPFLPSPATDRTPI